MRLHDFTAYNSEMQSLNLGEVFEDLSAACQGAAALLILNNHRKYLDLKLSVPFAVLDVWKVCKKIQTPKYCTIGNLLISEEGKKCAE